MILHVPENSVSMSTFIEKKLNGFEEMHSWRDEDGCGGTTIGRKCTRIMNLKNSEFLIFILSRLIIVDDQLKIMKTRVSATENISIKDFSGHSEEFCPIAIIHHTGEVSANTTRGHYRADVMQESTKKWFRTSDDDKPVEIEKEHISERGYIYLYKKISG